MVQTWDWRIERCAIAAHKTSGGTERHLEHVGAFAHEPLWIQSHIAATVEPAVSVSATAIVAAKDPVLLHRRTAYGYE